MSNAQKSSMNDILQCTKQRDEVQEVIKGSQRVGGGDHTLLGSCLNWRSQGRTVFCIYTLTLYTFLMTITFPFDP